jgi:predicted MFS family arabinose efflux permease
VILTDARPPTRRNGLGAEFWILGAGTFINRAGTMVVPFMTLYLVTARRFSVVGAGELLAGFGAGALVAPLVGGALADHAGRGITLLGSTLTTSATLVALAYTRSPAAIVALVLLLGVTLEAPRPVTQALVADLVAEQDRVRAYSVLFWLSNLGFAVAMASAGFLAQTGFTVLFWADAVTGLVFGVLVSRFVREPDRRDDAPVSDLGGYTQVLRHRAMAGFTLAVMTYYFVYLQSDATLPLAVHRSGLSPRVYGMCMALNGALICLAQPLLSPRLSRRDPRTRMGGGRNARRARLRPDGYRVDGRRVPAVGRRVDSRRDLPRHGERSNRGATRTGGTSWTLFRPLRVRVASGWLTSSIGGTRLPLREPISPVGIVRPHEPRGRVWDAPPGTEAPSYGG